MSDPTQDAPEPQPSAPRPPEPAATEGESAAAFVAPSESPREATSTPGAAEATLAQPPPDSDRGDTASPDPEPPDAPTAGSPAAEAPHSASDASDAAPVELGGPATESVERVEPAADTRSSQPAPAPETPVRPAAEAAPAGEDERAATTAVLEASPEAAHGPAPATRAVEPLEPAESPSPAEAPAWAPWTELRLQQAIARRLDQVVRLGQDLVDVRLFGPRTHNGLLREAQLRNATTVATSTASIEALKNWLRYQTTRPDGRGWQHERFGQALVDQIEGPLTQLAHEAARDAGAAEHQAEALLRLVRLHLGYLDRHFAYREHERVTGERRSPTPRPAAAPPAGARQRAAGPPAGRPPRPSGEGAGPAGGQRRPSAPAGQPAGPSTAIDAPAAPQVPGETAAAAAPPVSTQPPPPVAASPAAAPEVPAAGREGTQDGGASTPTAAQDQSPSAVSTTAEQAAGASPRVETEPAPAVAPPGTPSAITADAGAEPMEPTASPASERVQTADEHASSTPDAPRREGSDAP